jgi:hypothetical protein
VSALRQTKVDGEQFEGQLKTSLSRAMRTMYGVNQQTTTVGPYVPSTVGAGVVAKIGLLYMKNVPNRC